MPKSNKETLKPQGLEVKKFIKSFIDIIHPFIVFCYRVTAIIVLLSVISMFISGVNPSFIIINLVLGFINVFFFTLYMLTEMYYERNPIK